MRRQTRLIAVKPMGAMGRVLIPAEARRAVGLEEGSSVRIHLGDDFIVLEAVDPGECPTCGKPRSRARRPSDD